MFLCFSGLAAFDKMSQEISIQGSAKRRAPGLVNFITAVAYHFCLSLPAAFTQPGSHILAEPCSDKSLSRMQSYTGLGYKVGPRLREYFRQVGPEVIGNSRNRVHQTWGPPFSRALFIYRQTDTLATNNTQCSFNFFL